jgi:hypothetical protein
MQQTQNLNSDTKQCLTRRWLEIIGVFAVVLWAGSTWTLGYVVAPKLFSAYSKVQAGEIAGVLFFAGQLLGLACGAVLLLDYRVRFSKQIARQRGFWLVLALVFCVLIQYTMLSPMIAAAKLAQDWPRFGQLHGVSQILYLAQSLGLGWLVYLKCLLPAKQNVPHTTPTTDATAN